MAIIPIARLMMFGCKTLKDFINSLKDYCDIYEPNNHPHYLSLQAFFFLLILIHYEKNIKTKSSFIVNISTELAIGEGLGNPSSFAVCFSRHAFIVGHLCRKDLSCMNSTVNILKIF